MTIDKVVLAYSGGLDTSVAVRWIIERYQAKVITLTIDLGGQSLPPDLKERALKAGATDSIVIDAREIFARDFALPALRAGALYEGHYPLATALGRPLIAQLLVRVAREQDASAVAHGCTGKGNDQVRFDISVAALNPNLSVVAPAREWGMSREEEVLYAQKHGIPVSSKVRSPYSTDANLWGRSVEAGALEDPSKEPPEDAYEWTRAIADTPDNPVDLQLEFVNGMPTTIDGEALDLVALISHLNEVGGENGIGRIDMVENRLVGIKSREIYEAPAATILHKSHQALESLTLSKEQARFKTRLSQDYADLVYDGLWFTAHRQDLDAYVLSSQRFVTGAVKVRLHKGQCEIVGRESPFSLYRHELATYDHGDRFDHRASEGFIAIKGLPVRTQTQIQLNIKES